MPAPTRCFLPPLLMRQSANTARPVQTRLCHPLDPPPLPHRSSIAFSTSQCTLLYLHQEMNSGAEWHRRLLMHVEFTVAAAVTSQTSYSLIFFLYIYSPSGSAVRANPFVLALQALFVVTVNWKLQQIQWIPEAEISGEIGRRSPQQPSGPAGSTAVTQRGFVFAL